MFLMNMDDHAVSICGHIYVESVLFQGFHAADPFYCHAVLCRVLMPHSYLV